VVHNLGGTSRNRSDHPQESSEFKMAYDAKVLEVMIASPGDVSAERQIVREVLNDWNVMHARTRKAILVPVGWETHSAPELAGRPQQMINDRLLVHCDLLVGIFWTRLGSPTGESASGTVEEIEEHIGSGKPAMLYFSSAPVVPQSLDAEQFGKLQEFKAWAMTRGLIAEFDSIEEFRERLRRDLELNLRDNPHLADLLQENPSQPAVEGQSHRKVKVSAEAARLLKAAADSRDGIIMALRHMSGVRLQAGGKQMLPDNAGPREVAKWTGALEILENLGLIEATSYKREVFRVTDSGYDAADQIDLASISPEDAGQAQVNL
jgi:hypothetical protein